MAAADAMVHSTAGLTVLEAHIRGCPVVSYGFSAGHLRANNAAFERFGLAEVARSEHELESVLRHVTRERRSPDSSFASLPSIASRALTVRPRVKPQPVWRLRAERVAAAVCLASCIAVLVARCSRVVDRETPYRVIAKAAKPIEGRIHFGKDSDTTPAVVCHAGDSRRRRPRRGRTPPAPTVDRGRWPAPAPRPPRSCTPARRWRRSCPGSARRCGIVLRQDGADGRRAHLRRRPAPAGHAARCWRPCARRGAPATFFLAGEQVERRPALAAEIVAAGHRVELHCHRHRNQLRLSAAAAARRRRTRQGGDRGGERAGDLRLPPALRDLQRRRAARGAPPRLAARALVAVGEGLDAAAPPPPRSRVDATRRRRGRRHPAPARRRLLQRAGLLGPHRRPRCR